MMYLWHIVQVDFSDKQADALPFNFLLSSFSFMVEADPYTHTHSPNVTVFLQRGQNGPTIHLSSRPQNRIADLHR